MMWREKKDVLQNNSGVSASILGIYFVAFYNCM